MSARRRHILGRQGGITLLLSILVLLTLTFIGLGLMDFVGFDNDVSSNAAVHAAMVQASDIGLADASQSLIAARNYPELLAAPGPWWYTPGYPSNIIEPAEPVSPATQPPPTPTPGVPTAYITFYTNAFWQNCATSKTPDQTCGVVTTPITNSSGVTTTQTGVTIAGRTYQVEYVIEPTGLPPPPLNGFETGTPSTQSRVYDAYVFVFRDNSSGSIENSVLIEAGMRKVGG
ncbi:hypothetical protein [Acidiferrobacter sp.]|uniref:hypothetical protein n=1 Tax=Acidiferrobacter sp. TaxID=1872107 RepID=UPI002602E955|nr:hypothetical protein [Acidiferrobacter sp.]